MVLGTSAGGHIPSVGGVAPATSRKETPGATSDKNVWNTFVEDKRKCVPLTLY
jgi:hypothetical protein